MISYEELCAALDRYVARTGGTPATSSPPPARPPAPHAPPKLELVPDRDPPTNQTLLPVGIADGDGEEHTQVGDMQPMYDLGSQELDVISDEEHDKN